MDRARSPSREGIREEGSKIARERAVSRRSRSAKTDPAYQRINQLSGCPDAIKFPHSMDEQLDDPDEVA